MGGEVVAAMRRVGKGWKTNLSRGGKAEPCELTDELRKISARAAEVVGCEYAGVDLIEHEGKLHVIEVNAIPGWKGLQSTTKVNIAEKIIDQLLGKAR